MLGQSWSPPGRCHNHSVVAGRYQCRCHAAEYPNQYGAAEVNTPTNNTVQLNTSTNTVQRDTNNSLNQYCAAEYPNQYCAQGYQRYYLASLLCWIPIPVPAIQHLAFLGDTNAEAILNTSTIFYQLCAPGYQQLFTDTKFVQLNNSCSLAVLVPAILIPCS